MNLMQSLKENDSICLGLRAQNWSEAIKLSVKPLIDSGAVTEAYYHAILELTEKYGPYYILMPGMAMPHARPEAGVNRTAFSLISLTEPVTFSDGKEVSVLLTLAAISSEIHTSVAIPQIVALFELENSIERLVAAKHKEEIFKMLEESKSNPFLEELNLDREM
ncbi:MULTISPECIES: PTS sugar transporter subunit IIA [Lactococcus]|uniref:PTS sugar transporter subunit IIA n=1 Tax=Lactococcus TaxID=1357 RepID=UPI000EEF71CA|nr:MULTISPECIES: PTS sugar transporter subunit IIA [Lactococcus]HAP16107.1 PTS ascorbate transporter subunit IIA [Lactococcus sp.]